MTEVLFFVFLGEKNKFKKKKKSGKDDWIHIIYLVLEKSKILQLTGKNMQSAKTLKQPIYIIFK